MKSVIVSGIRATGRLHLGNYIGVLESMAAMSRDPTNDCYFFVADLHSLTTHTDAANIQAHATEIVKDLLAAGVDAERSTIYVQSWIPTIPLLSWYLGCLTPVAELDRMATFKDKVQKHSANVNVGLLTYPVLMAADILGVRAKYVPIGPDQRPHLELARDLARRFNKRRGEKFFPVPKEHTFADVAVPGLYARTPDGIFPKMGKSEDARQTIYLSDSAAEIEAKIARAPTDPARVLVTDCGTPEVCAIHALHGVVSSPELLISTAHGCRTATINCYNCKKELAGSVNARLTEFRERRREFDGSNARIMELLHAGSERAATQFAETTAAVGECLGAYRPV